MGNKIDIIKEHNDVVNECLNNSSKKKSLEKYESYINSLSNEQLDELGKSLFCKVKGPIKSLLINRLKRTLEIKNNILNELNNTCFNCEVSPRTINLLNEYNKLGKEELINIDENGKIKRVKKYECKKI